METGHEEVFLVPESASLRKVLWKVLISNTIHPDNRENAHKRAPSGSKVAIKPEIRVTNTQKTIKLKSPVHSL